MADVPESQGTEPKLAAMLVRVQQTLLAAGYRYAAGNVDEWPLTQVLLTRERDLLYVCPFRGARADEDARLWESVRRQGGTLAGLLLVGDLDPADPAVRRFYDGTRGTVAYIDVTSGTFTLRRSWNAGSLLRPLTQHNLRKFLGPAQDRKSLAIDCRARLRVSMKEQEQEAASSQQAVAFFQQARNTGQIGRPTMTYFVIAGLAAIFVAMVGSSRDWKAALTPPARLLMDWGALYGPAVRAGQWWRIFTCGGVHVGLVHLLFNLMALYIFGSVLEMLQGRWRLAILLVWNVICGSLARLSWDPMILSAGASGGIFGLIGALLAVVIRYWGTFPPTLAKMYRKWLMTVLLYNAVFLIDPRIDSVAHAGGFLGGLVMGLILCRSPVKVSWPSFWTWPALAAMVLGACLIARNAISRIPASSLDVIEGGLLRERLEALSEFSERVREFGEGPRQLAKAYDDAVKAAPAERARLRKAIRDDLLPAMQDPNTLASLRELAVRAQSEKHALRSTLEALLGLREQYGAAVLAAVEKRPGPHDLSVIQLGLRVASAQSQMEAEAAMALLELNLEARGHRQR